MITKYFAQFDKVINKANFITSSEIQKRKVNNFLGIIEGKIIIEDKTLDILEVIKITDQQLSKTKYKYHFQDSDNSLIFRYDNAPHHKEIETFPHHKHLPEKVTACNEPNLLQILSAINKICE
jgi:hypothetical protein